MIPYFHRNFPDTAEPPLFATGEPRAIELTKRELFAAMAVQGLLASNSLGYKDAVKYGVEAADALIAKLNEVKP